jgi:hypothetical protein
MARLPGGKSPASDAADVGGAALKLVGAPDFIGSLVTLAGIRSNGSIDGFMKQTLKTMKQSGDQLGAGLPGGAEFRIRTGGFADNPQSGEVQVSRWVRQTAGTDR